MWEIICIKRYNFKIKWEMCKGLLPLSLKMLYEFTTNSEDFTLEVTKILLFKIYTWDIVWYCLSLFYLFWLRQSITTSIIMWSLNNFWFYLSIEKNWLITIRIWLCDEAIHNSSRKNIQFQQDVARYVVLRIPPLVHL
jgi:hypothetical protein